jgi:hypothetical protein
MREVVSAADLRKRISDRMADTLLIRPGVFLDTTPSPLRPRRGWSELAALLQDR